MNERKYYQIYMKEFRLSNNKYIIEEKEKEEGERYFKFCFWYIQFFTPLTLALVLSQS